MVDLDPSLSHVYKFDEYNHRTLVKKSFYAAEDKSHDYFIYSLCVINQKWTTMILEDVEEVFEYGWHVILGTRYKYIFYLIRK
jgi:hypothetical protein